MCQLASHALPASPARPSCGHSCTMAGSDFNAKSTASGGGKLPSPRGESRATPGLSKIKYAPPQLRPARRPSTPIHAISRKERSRRYSPGTERSEGGERTHSAYCEALIPLSDGRVGGRQHWRTHRRRRASIRRGEGWVLPSASILSKDEKSCA
eukprot:scaffold26867_cov28-Tisochrysis_lutea.AAC.3